MKTRKIGIVLTELTDKEIKGFLAYSKVGLELDDLNRVTLEHEVEEYKSFTLDLETQEYRTNTFCNRKVSEEIGRELKKIGFKNVKLRFNGEICEILD